MGTRVLVGAAGMLLLYGGLQAGGSTTPHGLLHGPAEFDDIDTRRLTPPDVAALLEEDSRRPRDVPSPLRVAIPLALGLDIHDAGTWNFLPGGAAAWRLRVTSPGALFLRSGVRSNISTWPLDTGF